MRVSIPPGGPYPAAELSRYHDVKLAAMTGGNVTRSASQAVKETTVTLTITPETGYELDTITVTGASGAVTLSGEGSTRTFTMPDEDVTVNATFKKLKFTIDHSGLVNLKCDKDTTGSAHSHEVEYGDAAAIKLVPDEGYDLPNSTEITIKNAQNVVITGWTINDEGTITFSGGVTSNLTIEAAGVRKTYTVNYTLTNGLNSESARSVKHGEAYTGELKAEGTTYLLPRSITVTMGGKAFTDFAYDSATGIITIAEGKITADMVITASGRTPGSSSSGSGTSRPATSTEVTTNPDGSKTTTVTDREKRAKSPHRPAPSFGRD